MAVGQGITTALRPVAGVRLAVGAAGIKTPGKQDLVLIALAAGTRLSAVYTRNRFCAAPVTLARQRSEARRSKPSDEPALLLINTGNANAGTGQRGMEAALETTHAAAVACGLGEHQVLPFSTGVIGEYLPVERINACLPETAGALGEADWYQVARTILTTDTRSKGHSETVQVGDQEVTITGISKGSGMIRPDMATMLSFVFTDADVLQADLDGLLQQAVTGSFNRITVDGDTSTNDACILAATGASGLALDPTHPVWEDFATAVERVMLSLALQIIRDGEGATRMMAVRVHHAANIEEALAVAFTVAHSPLVKTALAAGDANWGRILAAVGRAPIDALALDKVSIDLEDVPLVRAGERHPDYTEAQGAAVFSREEFTVHIGLGRGEVVETVWTSDLSHEYVSINADYRT